MKSILIAFSTLFFSVSVFAVQPISGKVEFASLKCSLKATEQTSETATFRFEVNGTLIFEEDLELLSSSKQEIIYTNEHTTVRIANETRGSTSVDVKIKNPPFEENCSGLTSFRYQQ